MELLTIDEKVYIIGIISIITFFLTKSLLSKNKLEIFSPIVFIGLVYLVYTVIGPLIFINIDMKVFPKHFMRQFYKPAWFGSFLSILSIFFGYFIYSNGSKIIKQYDNKYNKMFFIALIINIIGISLYAIANPSRFIAQLNPFSNSVFSETGEFGGFMNYLNMGINFLIVGNALMLLSMKKLNLLSSKFWVFILFLLLSLSIYSSLGFRYRILLLFSTLMVAYYLSVQKRPPLTVILIVLPIFIMSMGIIGIIRNHNKGLNLSKLDRRPNQSYLLTAFKETNIFPISGVIIKAVPEKVDFVGNDILINTIMLPIPRKFYPEKNTDQYIRDPIKVYKELEQIDAHKWAAMLFFSEWYIAYGWYGLIGISFILGFIYRRIWEWTKTNIDNRYAIVVYSISLSFLYFFITRGYLPGALTIFVFTVLPANIVRFFGRLNIFENRELT